MKYLLVLAATLLLQASSFAQGPLRLALVKYNGGGDWYAVVTALENMAKFANAELKTNFAVEYNTVEIGSVDVFNYPFLFMTGHGNIVLSGQETDNLRTYLMAGGFMFVDDDFGMDSYIRPQLDKLLPDSKLVELPYSHPIFHQRFNFAEGMPKVHQHDGKQPHTYGLFIEDRLVLVYATESNISDGWEDRAVHNDPEETRTQALRMGANLLQYVFRF
jgi:Domain of unknown function (DUF4159)